MTPKPILRAHRLHGAWPNRSISTPWVITSLKQESDRHHQERHSQDLRPGKLCNGRLGVTRQKYNPHPGTYAVWWTCQVFFYRHFIIMTVIYKEGIMYSFKTPGNWGSECWSTSLKAEELAVVTLAFVHSKYYLSFAGAEILFVLHQFKQITRHLSKVPKDRRHCWRTLEPQCHRKKQTSQRSRILR